MTEASDPDKGVEIDFRSDGTLSLSFDDGERVDVHLSPVTAQHLARAMLQYAAPEAFASRMGALSREAGHG